MLFSYQQKIHTAIKFDTDVLMYINRINQIIFITKDINANIVFLFNFSKVFSRNEKFNAFIIKIINQFLSAFLFFQDVFLVDLYVRYDTKESIYCRCF